MSNGLILQLDITVVIRSQIRVQLSIIPPTLTHFAHFVLHILINGLLACPKLVAVQKIVPLQTALG